MHDDIKQRSLDWLCKQLKQKRISQAHAEQRHKKQAENGHCLECELRNIKAGIEVVEYLIDMVMKGV